ncbi:hypothetical protein RHDC3_02364 [Rhodocyclaceae bacterium]|nr:hypothetical protein RHDC3_02364 [Rhodocyclaceae bacterium]
MKLKHLTLAAALLAAFAVPATFAQGTSKPQSREQVKAEAEAAHKSGDMEHGDATTAPKPTANSKLSRAAVKAKGEQAHKAGDMEHGEASTSAKPGKSTKDRKQVKAEGEAAHKDGTMVHGEATQSPKK